MPRGMLYDTNWSGIAVGLTHMAELGAQAAALSGAVLLLAVCSRGRVTRSCTTRHHPSCFPVHALVHQGRAVHKGALADKDRVGRDKLRAIQVVDAILGSEREGDLHIVASEGRVCADELLRRLVSAGAVNRGIVLVFVVDRDEAHVDVLEEGVLVHAVYSDGEEGCLLEVKRRLGRERVEGACSGRAQVQESNEGVDRVLDADGAPQLPGKGTELDLVQVEAGLVDSDVRVDDSARLAVRAHPSEVGVDVHSLRRIGVASKVSNGKGSNVGSIEGAVSSIASAATACPVIPCDVCNERARCAVHCQKLLEAARRDLSRQALCGGSGLHPSSSLGHSHSRTTGRRLPPRSAAAAVQALGLEENVVNRDTARPDLDGAVRRLARPAVDLGAVNERAALDRGVILSVEEGVDGEEVAGRVGFHVRRLNHGRTGGDVVDAVLENVASDGDPMLQMQSVMSTLPVRE
eukprot:1547769-Rhodomonas_salina.1